MNVVQSLWTKPFKINQNGRFDGGWLSEKYNYISWTLSFLLLQKHYGEVNLITDRIGYSLLVDHLNLPYKHVDMSLEMLSDYPDSIWALGKIHAYAMQEQSFMHVDGDVFLWEPLNKKLINSDFFCQNLEVNGSIYETAFELLEAKGFVLTTELLQKTKPLQACNAGVIGGVNLKIWKELHEHVLCFIHRNEAAIRSANDTSVLNIVLEQYLIFQIIEKYGITPEVVFDSSQIRSEEDLMIPASIERAIHNMQYNHLLGIAKKDPLKLRIMERMLQLNYPRYYYKILGLLN